MNSNRLILEQIELGPMANYVYLVGCPDTREVAVVDPAWDVPAIMAAAEGSGVTIRHVLLTHGHPDHMNGLQAVLEETDARVHIQGDELEYMKLAAATFGLSLDFMSSRAGNLRTLSDGDIVHIGKVALEALHTPGHTPGSQCFLVQGNLISGDTLFIGACGRVDLPGGDPEKLWWSLNRKLKPLADDTVLYPGHNYAERPTSTLGDERRHNPYMQFETPETFLRMMRIY